MILRQAGAGDTNAIATLHAQSWRIAYKNIYSDDFLKNEVLEDRLAVWQPRLETPAPNQFVLLAEDGGQLLGFVCVFADEDAQWGSLIDNLHVDPELKGRGIGARLMQEAAIWVQQQAAASILYLWVYEENRAARRFYERLGGVQVELVLGEAPYNRPTPVLRYAWASLEPLLQGK